VVIGILIALQVNNWNGERENRAIANDYYCQLLSDLELDMSRLESLTEEHHEKIKNGKQLIKDLHAMKKSKDELLLVFKNVARSNRFVPTNVAYSDIISSGHLGILKNKQLKKSLITYNTELENFNHILEGNRAFQTAQMVSWDDVLEFGWQSPSISGGLILDEELLSLLPVNDWHLDKENPIFKKFQSVTYICLTTSDRKIQIYEQIMESMQPLLEDLTDACQIQEP
jgi:mannose/fructose/N-acetylgalactosamine-specific phosphotransferase system component IIB